MKKYKRLSDALASVLDDEEWHDISELMAAGRPCVSAERALNLAPKNKTYERATEQREVRRDIFSGERRAVQYQIGKWKQQGLIEADGQNGNARYRRVGYIPLRTGNNSRPQKVTTNANG